MAKTKFKSRNPKPARPPDKLPLPLVTSTAFETNGSNCQNIGLIFERYLHFVENRDRDWDMGTYSTGTKKSDTARSWNLNNIVEAQKRLNNRWNSSLLSQAIARWQYTVKSQHACDPFRMTPEWRFVAGLGDKTALEVGFTFHRIYGYPLIPGSALKGLARATALWNIAETLGVPRLSLSEAKKRAEAKQKKWCQNELCETPLAKLETLLMAYDERISEAKQRQTAKKAEDKVLETLRSEKGLKDLALYSAEEQITQFRCIFGTTHVAGQAMFFEAVPAAAPTLEVDIMNVHYPDYYGEGNKPPADNQNLNPIPFLTVGQTPFWFAVGWRGKTANEKLRSQAVAWLKAGLRDFGLGAKTAAGYGYFEEQ